MSDYIPDPIELMESRQERLIDAYVDEYTCMQCGEKKDYELVCTNPIDGPLVCYECLGFDPFKHLDTPTPEKEEAND